MAHDVVVRGGTVVDGTGAPPRVADVGIDAERITEISPAGTLSGHRTIDADGLLVTPGFVDIHTHYDAQVGWDPLLTSSCWHGVTSVVLGNCGMTFAPVRPDDRGYLARCMESVEDIPSDSIVEGLTWEWETYGEYLGALGRSPLGLNVGGMVGHAALRYWAMGDRSLDPDASPTPAELDEMTRLVDEAMAAGALGLSTSRTLRHAAPDGRRVPGTFAELEELGALADVLGRHGRGVLEAAPRFDGDGPSEPRARSEIALMEELSRRSGRPFTFNLTHTWANPEHHRLAIELVTAANTAGATIRPQTTSRGIGVLFTLGGSTPFASLPAWQRLAALPRAERTAALRDPDLRAELAAEGATKPDAGFAGFYLTGVEDDSVRYDCDPATELPALAAATGRTVVDVYLDALDRSDGGAVVYWPVLNQSIEAIGEMLSEDTVVLGLADGGAHVSQILDASQPSWFLSYWVRERGLCSIERAIQRLAADGAALYGLGDRGVLAPGKAADVNLIDLDAVALPRPEVVDDLPLGAARYRQQGRGYVATLVNGSVLMEHGEHTGELPGHVLRSR